MPLRTLLVIAIAFMGMDASARCVCRCTNGVNIPICERANDPQPACPPMICPIAPPSITPIQMPVPPPPGTTNCMKQQVLNPVTGKYEWRTICQ